MKKILIVDDSKMARKVFMKSVRELECEVLEASNGEEGLKLCAEMHPDLVICDLLMPGFNGFQFLKEYTKWEARAPVIICSSDVQEETREKCFELGADEFIKKPSLTDADSFMDIVRRCTTARRTT